MLAKMQMLKQGNSIYFTCDKMVCFPKSSYMRIYVNLPLLVFISKDQESTYTFLAIDHHNYNITCNTFRVLSHR